MLVSNARIVSEDPHDSVAKSNSTFGFLVHSAGLDQFCDCSQSIFGIPDYCVYHGALAGIQETGLEATEAMCFFDHKVDMTGSGEEIGCLFTDSFELVSHLENLDCSVYAGRDCGERIWMSDYHLDFV